MSDDYAELTELADSVFGDAWDPVSAGLDAGLWATLEQTGLDRLTLPEAAGGSGASFAEAGVVAAAAGRFAARVPLVETDWLAGWLLHAAGGDLPDGPLSAALHDGRLTAPAGAVSGSELPVPRVAFGRSVSTVVVLDGERVLTLRPLDATVDEGVNVAEEPRDTLTGPFEIVGTVSAEVAAEYPLRAALGRALLLAGAARGALAMAVRYAGERVQFGRPIAKLQAIQQTLALAAGEVAAAEAASTAAAREVDRLGFAGAELAIAAAKARCGEAAGQVARIAHQVHGAIGFTREHDLRLVTTRLWAWRDEDGPETAWNRRLGELALDAGADGLWPLLTGRP